MIKWPDRNQTIAIAGVFQSCQLVDDLARTGSVAAEHLTTAVNSLLEQNPPSSESLFGQLANLSVGFNTLHQLLTQRAASSNTLRYVIGALHLQRKLLHSPVVLNQVAAGIAEVGRQVRLGGFSDNAIVDKLAELYQQTISTFHFRIQVNGQGGYLQQPVVVNRVRCLLFAGIRAGVHWHHLGGRRWHLILCRKQLLQYLTALRAGIAKHPAESSRPQA